MRIETNQNQPRNDINDRVSIQIHLSSYVTVFHTFQKLKIERCHWRHGRQRKRPKCSYRNKHYNTSDEKHPGSDQQQITHCPKKMSSKIPTVLWGHIVVIIITKQQLAFLEHSCTRHRAKNSTSIIPGNPHHEICPYHHHIDGDTEALRGGVVCPRSQG